MWGAYGIYNLVQKVENNTFLENLHIHLKYVKIKKSEFQNLRKN